MGQFPSPLSLSKIFMGNTIYVQEYKGKIMGGLNSIAVDTDAEETGVWNDLGDMSFLVARAGNEKWKNMHKRLEKQAYGAQLRKRGFERDPDKDTKILIECLAYTCLLDWKNVTLDGKEVVFSPDMAHDILSDKRFKRLTDFILEVALDEERYLEEVVAEDEGK